MATDKLAALQAFQAVAQAQSFTKAAARLQLDKSKISRSVRELEQLLGATLLVRSTRSVRVTPDGEVLLRHVSPHLAALEAATEVLTDRVAIPAGEVTIATTPDIGRDLLAPTLAGFRARYPDVRVRMLLGADMVDMMRDDADIAVRVGQPGGNTLVARRIGELTSGFFAAPAYLKRRGTPTKMEHMSQHDGLWPTPPRGQKSFTPGRTPPEPAIASSDFGLLAEVARTGGGIALLPTFMAARDVAAGALVRVLPDFSLANAPVYIVSRPIKTLPPRVQVLRTALLEAKLLG
ncbi:MAG TPA: LysR substrate-binding domain-containing protein [Kofleriaceae bacterium]|nr:LysR substrate-binding domain-containing protein [Kofleriaceae bacterium]